MFPSFFLVLFSLCFILESYFIFTFPENFFFCSVQFTVVLNQYIFLFLDDLCFSVWSTFLLMCLPQSIWIHGHTHKLFPWLSAISIMSVMSGLFRLWIDFFPSCNSNFYASLHFWHDVIECWIFLCSFMLCFIVACSKTSWN